MNMEFKRKLIIPKEIKEMFPVTEEMAALKETFSFMEFYTVTEDLEKMKKSGEREKSETKINNLRYFLVFLPCQ